MTANASTYSTNAIQANVANIANSVSGSNVSGAVANATYALTANASTYSTNAIQANVANIANSVAGANVSGTVANATYALTANASTYSTNAVQANVANIANSVSGSNVSGTVGLTQYVTQSAQANITSVGTLTSLSVSGNTTSGNLLTSGLISATGTITGSNLSTSGNVLAVNGSYSGFLSVAGNIYANSIVSPQTLIITDPLVYFQNTQTYPYTYDIGFYSGFTGGTGNTYQHTGLTRDYTDNTWKLFSNVPEPAGSSMDLTNAIYDPIMTGNISVIGITSATGNVTGGNIVTSGSVNATGNITGGNISISGVTTLTGNVTSRHILPAANVTYDLGSPTQMWRSIYVSGNTIYVGTSNLSVTDGNLSVGSNPVVTVSPTGTSNTTGNMNVVGNITGSNVISSGLITATGNITGNYLVGNGSQLTGMYGNANVATYLPTYSGNLSPGNISSVTGTITGVVIPKANTVTDGTSISINTDLADLFIQTNTQTAGTLTINAPSGTPVNGQKFMIRLSSTAIQTFSWNAIYAGSTDLPLPGTSSGSGKYDYLGFIYNSTATKWQLLAKTFGF